MKSVSQASPEAKALWDRFHGKPYRGYGRYLRERFGAKVFKVVVDAGFTCPNRDGSAGYGGCAYCNVESFTPRHTRSLPTVREQVVEGIERSRRSYGARRFMIYFQPNTNTYAPVGDLERIYREAVESVDADIVGLTIGTRPDCIDREKLSMLKRAFGDLYVSIEYGMESVNDDTLSCINRGTTHAQFEAAVKMTADFGFDVCAHTIFGLPGEFDDDGAAVAETLNRLPIAFVKLHHLHVVRGSILAKRYREKPFPLHSLESYIDTLSCFLPRLDPSIVVQRLFGIADFDDLIAPNWDLPKTAIQYRIESALLDRGVAQGMEFDR
ncbi:TIGR01212 family radical SAM protein [Pelagicoccus sp. SDUM812003]|uniref:TIGR01212 family radical SAM protein n=1 Tax=Pelagicoccus sp. SDUM812003 TaxID=3041267 RepID=UPI00280EF5A5|nr:TIGR01212 family radical SAM protein [Pelagicoccus sp. SDUM812003]MDQ8203116.1 TIGR01212 family radical SAM protein [Pelagicoccus sp. SDUM812003]